ncbi:hypothetical protein DPMN_089924 [Dreissena polymorpha]|uniref:Uncharacterized protein n=1 Tax=Dreissena polymorpha TaxID=45954 RepID=A0A9D4KWT0_DREPO|nr:hypothetical protein DPMN_089924 [Dreissena polymorpha]
MSIRNHQQDIPMVILKESDRKSIRENPYGPRQAKETRHKTKVNLPLCRCKAITDFSAKKVPVFSDNSTA